MNPFFSIITVTKNTEQKVGLTIKSVLSQNFNNFEYIIVDGYSKDRTFSKIKEYKNKKIKVFRYKDRNFYDGLNYGVKQAKGKYIAILNSGDFFFSNVILITIKKKITFKYLNIFTGAMEQGGMSSNLKYLLLKLREDLIIHRKYFKYYIVHFLIQKFNKLRSLNFVRRKVISNKILRTLKNLKCENNY